MICRSTTTSSTSTLYLTQYGKPLSKGYLQDTKIITCSLTSTDSKRHLIAGKPLANEVFLGRLSKTNFTTQLDTMTCVSSSSAHQ